MHVWPIVRCICLAVTTLLGAGVLRAGDLTGRVTSPRLKSLQDVVVYLEGAGLPATPPAEPVVMDQKEIRFVPHVLPVVKGSVVAFRNSDATPHNVNSTTAEAKFNETTYPKGKPALQRFDQVGVVEILCNVHQQMAAFVVVVPTSAYTLAAADGSFAIRGLPAGSYELVVRHPQLAPVRRSVTIEESGEIRVEIAIP